MLMKWPNQLVNCIARNKSVLFLGAGLSMNSTDNFGTHPKDWKGFLISGSNTLEPELCSGFLKEWR